MSFFEFPNTRTYDSDLGWLIKHVGINVENIEALRAWADIHKEQYEDLENKVQGLIENLVNVIVPWDSSIAYRIYSIVEYQGTNYIALQNVPIGTMITNTDFWQPAQTVVEQINAISLSVGEFHKGNVKYYGAKGDGTTDDTAAINRAIADASDVYFPEGVYVVSEPIYFDKDIVIHGGGAESIIKTNAEIATVFINSDTEVNNVEFYGLHFVGNVVQEPETNYPRRNQTYKDSSINMGMVHAIVLHGSHGNRATYTNPLHTANIHDCIFEDVASLPVLVTGVDSKTMFCNNLVQNCLDVGFIDCVNLAVNDNIIRMSADNGISVSSGNDNVSIVGNVIDLSCYHGIWCGGYAVSGTLYEGPNNLTIVGNSVRRCGYSGIYSYNNAYQFVANDNVVDTCYLKPLDGTETSSREEAGNGFYIGGVDSSNLATNIIVANNIIKNCKKNGVALKFVKHFTVNDNQMENIGSVYKLDGSAVTAGDSVYNNAVFVYNYSTDPTYGVIESNKVYPNTDATLFGKARFFGVVYATCKNNKFFGAANNAAYTKNTASSDILIIDDDNLRTAGGAVNYAGEYIAAGTHAYTLDSTNGSMYLIATVAGGTSGSITKAAIAIKMSSGVWLLKELVTDDTTTTYTISGDVLTVTNTYARNINIGKVSNGIAPTSYML